MLDSLKRIATLEQEKTILKNYSNQIKKDLEE